VLTPALPAGREFIAAHVPHQGRMCLLDTLLACDERRIVCSTATHGAPDNPLRSGGRLGAACSLEYGGQAMALHAGLLAAAGDATPQPGMLVAVREMHLAVAALDALTGALIIDCERLEADARTLLYSFEISCEGAPVARGRATLVVGLPVGFTP
jgi:predicted hotdog family 3-hydroxylacyl-ACP dehydratase